MANSVGEELSHLAPATLPITGSELVYLVQGGSSKCTTAAALADVLPDATPSTPGKLSVADKTRLDQLAATGSPSFAGLTITGPNAVMIPHIHGDVAGTLYFHVKNVSGGPLTRGTPVTAGDSVGDTDVLQVVATDPATPGAEYANGVLRDDLAVDGEGYAIIVGELHDVSTSAYTRGPLWVAGGGGLTSTRPASGAQQVATLGRHHAINGSLLVAIQGVEPTPAQIGAQPADVDLTAIAALTTQPFGRSLLAVANDAAARALIGAVAGDDTRLANAREWDAQTVNQAEAEAGASGTRRAWTAQRVRQAIAAWWVGVSASPGAIGETTPSTGRFTGVGLGGVAPRAGFAVVLGSNVLPRAQIVTISGSTYTCDIRAANRFMLAGDIAGNTTIAFSNVADLVATKTTAEYVEVEVDFHYIVGVITISAAGFTTKWDGNVAATPTAGEIETLIVRITPAIAGTPFSTATVYVAPMRGRT